MLFGLPLDDWQFWVVTSVVICGGWVVVKMFIPNRKSKGACSSCASGSAANAKPRKVRLTVEGEKRK